MNRPLIGITSSLRVDELNGNVYYSAYGPNALAIERAGGLPVILPCDLQLDTLRGLYERVDGVLLPGGGDINPAQYGAAPHPTTDLIIDQRDLAEIAVARWAVEDDRPLLGICRGHQVLNVALGGTLLQDIPSLKRTNLVHDFPRNQRSRIAHSVTIDPSSKLAQVLGVNQVEVNSLHHQAVESLAPDLCATAQAPDGIIEASEIPDKRFTLSVQWHPEDMMTVNDEAADRLFKAFVAAARDR